MNEIGSFARRLIATIDAYGLADRYPELRYYRELAARGRLSEGIAKALLTSLQSLVEEQEDFPNLLHRSPTTELLYAVGPPDVELGSLIEGEQPRFGIRLLDRPRFVICAGSTGSGKTNSIRKALTGVHAMNRLHPERFIAMLILARKALHYRDLVDRFHPDCLLLNAHRNLHLSLAAPDGVPPTVWINIVATLFCARAGLVSSWVTFANAMRWALAALNPDPGKELLWPDLQLILDLLSEAPASLWSTKNQYTESLRQMLEGVTQASGDLFRCFRGLDLERDVIGRRRSAVIEIENLYPPWLRLFVVDLLISQVLLGRIHRRQAARRTEVLFVLDECDPDVSRKTEAMVPDGLSSIGQLMKQGRAFGLGAILGLTFMGYASRLVLSNAQYHLIFNMTDDESVLEARRTLMLPPGAEQILPALRCGQALFRESQGAWPHAMLVEVDHEPTAD